LPESCISPCSIDAGVVERDVLTIDAPQTIERLRTLLQSRDRRIADEVAAAGPMGVDLIAADIPFLAGDIAERLGVPCVAMGNFTWDWIGEPFLTGVHGGDALLASLTASYAKMSAVLRQPFSHPMPQFKRVIDVPMVVHRSRRERTDILRHLGLDPHDPRRRVLLGMRGGTSPAAIDAGVRSSPEFLFTALQSVPPRAPENLRGISREGLDFSDLLAVHDIVISKLGYGMVCDGIANRTRILWPRREGFREDTFLEADAPRYLRMREIPRNDYAAGRWEASLHAILDQAESLDVPRTDGAEVCAALLVDNTEWL
jgi:hypothetical protein